jgi:hypothetical protein
MSLEKINQVQDGLPLPHRYWAILAIGLGILVSVLDGVIANVALIVLIMRFQLISSLYDLAV